MDITTKESVMKLYKGIDILNYLEQDLQAWQNIMYLVFAKIELEFFTEPEIKVEPHVPDVDPILEGAKQKELFAKKKVLKIQHATFELTLMQHVGGEVKSLLQRKLTSLRNNKPGANGYEAWNALTLLFQGSGWTQKHMWITQFYDFKMELPCTRSNLQKGVNRFETIVAKTRELNVNIPDELLGIKLANSLPKDNTSCRIVYTNDVR